MCPVGEPLTLCPPAEGSLVGRELMIWSVPSGAGSPVVVFLCFSPAVLGAKVALERRSGWMES